MVIFFFFFQLSKVPWPHGKNQHGGRKNLSPAQLQKLGVKYFKHLDDSQNGTILATTLYSWTQPTYRQYNFVLSARIHNITALGGLITYMDIDSVPWVPQMFGLIGSTERQVLADLNTKKAAVWKQCATQNIFLTYALHELAHVKYTDSGAPPVLYRGGGRNTVFFCNQFSTDYGLTIDECVSKYFAEGGTIQVYPNWSTTDAKSVTNHYNGGVLYYILPNPTVRNSWHGKNINPFNINKGNDEWLYASNSRFVVKSVTCDTIGGKWNVTLWEAQPGTLYTRSRPNGRREFENCVSN